MLKLCSIYSSILCIFEETFTKPAKKLKERFLNGQGNYHQSSQGISLASVVN